MKHKLLFLIFSLSLNVFSQTDCKHGVSTDPNNPTNSNSLPVQSNGDENEHYLNGFDWFPIGAPGTPDEGIYLG